MRFPPLLLPVFGVTAITFSAQAEERMQTAESPTRLTQGAESQENSGDVEHTIVLGLGGAGELDLADGSLHPGANVMLEWDAIENWLEFELGASILSAEGGVEIPVDLLFKKPFRLGKRSELFVGLGPELVYVSNRITKKAYFGGEFAIDFFYWPWQHAGVWIEPTYDAVFRDGAAHGLGSTGGVLLGW
jgi:hypothetical protein